MKRNYLVLMGLLVFGLLLVGVTSPGFAQGGDPTEDEVNAVASQLYCPVCENVPLDACGTAACEQWRGIIRDKLAEGWSEDQIKAYFVEQYGDRVLAEPPRRGFNWLVYLVPVLALGAGAALLVLGFRKWRTPEQELKTAPSADNIAEITAQPSEEYIKKVEEELEERSRSSK
jgi:cytochrome c-type biogenesis protein CcmH